MNDYYIEVYSESATSLTSCKHHVISSAKTLRGAKILTKRFMLATEFVLTEKVSSLAIKNKRGFIVSRLNYGYDGWFDTALANKVVKNYHAYCADINFVSCVKATSLSEAKRKITLCIRRDHDGGLGDHDVLTIGRFLTHKFTELSTKIGTGEWQDNE